MERLDDGLWTLGIPFRAGGLELGARMTLLRAHDRRLVLHSPVMLDDARIAAIRALGEVGWIVAPNLMHYRYVPDAKAAFPQATVLGSPGLAQKRPALPIDGVLAGDVLAPTITLHEVGGMPSLREMVLLHRPTRTLVLTDLLFNIGASSPWLTRLYLKATGSVGKPSQTLLLKFITKDKAAVRASREALLDLDFDRVILAHGDVVERGGKDAVRAGLAWLG